MKDKEAIEHYYYKNLLNEKGLKEYILYLKGKEDYSPRNKISFANPKQNEVKNEN